MSGAGDLSSSISSSSPPSESSSTFLSLHSLPKRFRASCCSSYSRLLRSKSSSSSSAASESTLDLRLPGCEEPSLFFFFLDGPPFFSL
jgi:hypothetical protein